MDLANKGFAQKWATIVGAAYLAIGVLGFLVTGFSGFIEDGNASFLGLDLNGFHNLFHIAIGVFFLVVANFETAATEGALIGGGAVFIVAALLGFVGDDNLAILSIDGPGALDNFLHLVSGVAALLIGLISVSSGAAAERTRHAFE
jgi:hypothetical protein